MSSTPEAAVAAPPRPRVLVVDADPATLGLIDEWLADDGWQVVDEFSDGKAGVDVAIVDVPYPRDRGAARLCEIAASHPGVPLIVLSATFFGSVACGGPCAKALGVAGVLPKPVARDALIAALRRAAQPPRAA